MSAQGVELTVDGENQDIIYLDESISTYATVSGYSYSLVCTEPLNGATVNGSIVSSTASRGISLLLRITLSSEISKNTYFDVRLQYNSDVFGSISTLLYAYDKDYSNSCGSGVSFTGEHIASKKYIDFLEVGGTKRGIKYLEIYISLNDVTWSEVLPELDPEPDPSPSLYTFKINNTYFDYEPGMTFSQWVNSDYNTVGFVVDGLSLNCDGNTLYYRDTNVNTVSAVLYYDKVGELPANKVYYCGNSDILSLIEYQFNFSISSITINTLEDEKVSGGILGWVKSIFNGIVNLPQNIASKISSFFSELGNKITALGDRILDGIKSLFVPSEDDLIGMKEDFDELLSSRFGVLYDSASIVDNFADSFYNSPAMADLADVIEVPVVTVNLAGADFSFGGFAVDIVPEQFEGVIHILRTIVSIVCTFMFVNALRKRLEGVLH